MKKIGVLLSFLSLAFTLAAQKPEMSFEKKLHDFGNVNEADGPVSYVFEFVNKGKQPLVIHNVVASCGCTTPEWTRTPDRKSTRLNSSHVKISYAVFCLKKKRT